MSRNASLAIVAEASDAGADEAARRAARPTIDDWWIGIVVARWVVVATFPARSRTGRAAARRTRPEAAEATKPAPCRPTEVAVRIDRVAISRVVGDVWVELRFANKKKKKNEHSSP